MLTLETDRLILRPFAVNDSAFILRLLNEPSFIANIGDKRVRSLEQAADYLREGPMASYERHGHGLLAVVLRETMQPIGMCGLLKREEFEDIDIGYAFLPEAWSQGFARESAAAVLEFARQALGRTRIIALVSPHNQGSIRLLEKLGFSPATAVPMKGETSVYELNLAALPVERRT
jgi:RimJ/RimL family protein N-acetyltransferase